MPKTRQHKRKRKSNRGRRKGKSDGVMVMERTHTLGRRSSIELLAHPKVRPYFQANNFDLTLSAIGLKCIDLSFPLKIGTPEYVNRRVPVLKHNMLAI
ncbi:hypothetical protein MTR_5g008970 [Medicago truncatula]|uniref:Uncharacterized protein n=1 Tax=Medicago truncatula TaxID=3880 RepID=G7K995_MEDTR|nr:hypothetical protein MTR_5g008970 [Medicago truncatula]